MTAQYVTGGSFLLDMKPYYQDEAVTIYHGDCREILPSLPKVDLVLTDPPYPDIDKGFAQTPISILGTLPCRQLIFWSAVEPFPLSFSAVHIWHKPNGNSSQHYERVFERNGLRVCRVFRYAAILPNYTQFRNECENHPTQKPRKLICDLMSKASGVLILDPFMGSGTTLRAAKDLGRKAIGIEIEERYCEIAAKRMSQSVLDFETVQGDHLNDRPEDTVNAAQGNETGSLFSGLNPTTLQGSCNSLEHPENQAK